MKSQAIVQLLRDFGDDGKLSQGFPTTEFGYRKVRVERPLRLNFQASPERIARLEEESAFKNLAQSRKKDPEKKGREEAEGRAEQARIRGLLSDLPNTLFKDRKEFRKALQEAARRAGLKLRAPVQRAIESALSERDETAEICQDKQDNTEPDTDLRDYERVPLGDNVREYFAREVEPYVPDAWIDESYTDAGDSQVGRVGYEINFNRYFYEYVPPRPLEEIEDDIRSIEREIVTMLAEVTGSATPMEPDSTATSRPLRVAESHNPSSPGHDGDDRLASSASLSPQETYGLTRKTPEEVKEILAKLRAGLEDLYGYRLKGVYLFGSYARGDAVPGSDLDVLVILDEYESSWKEIERTGELTASLSLDFDVTIANIFMRESRWREGDTPLLSNVRQEGVPA